MAESLVAMVSKLNAPLELKRVPIPELAPGSALIQVEAATLCGTDAHRWTGELRTGTSTPFVPGHETTGRIVEMRGELRDILNEPVKIGDRVIMSYPICGHCYYCTVTRQTSMCTTGQSFGHSRSEELLGGCAEYHYFPAGGTYIHIPDEVPAPLAASAACALRTVMHGFELLGAIESHETVLIQGAGPLGLYAVAVARDRGANQVLVIGAPASRLELARQWGADEVCDLEKLPQAGERRAWALERSGGRGPDIVIQCASLTTIPEGLELIRPGGRYISIGSGGDAPMSVNARLFFKGIRISSVRSAEARHFYEAIQFLATRRKRFPFERLISGTYTLDQTTEALKRMAEFREIKPLILPKVAA